MIIVTAASSLSAMSHTEKEAASPHKALKQDTLSANAFEMISSRIFGDFHLHVVFFRLDMCSGKPGKSSDYTPGPNCSSHMELKANKTLVELGKSLLSKVFMPTACA